MACISSIRRSRGTGPPTSSAERCRSSRTPRAGAASGRRACRGESAPTTDHDGGCMQGRVTRRRFLGYAGAATVGLGALAAGVRSAAARKTGPQIFGSGRVKAPLSGRTIPSPSDFGFTAAAAGGNFVCSMFGPETGGFRGCNLMTVEGTVLPGSLQIHRGVATFAGEVAILVTPDVFFHTGLVLSVAPTPYTVEAKLGGPGKAYMVLHIPA